MSFCCLSPYPLALMFFPSLSRPAMLPELRKRRSRGPIQAWVLACHLSSALRPVAPEEEASPMKAGSHRNTWVSTWMFRKPVDHTLLQQNNNCWFPTGACHLYSSECLTRLTEIQVQPRSNWLRPQHSFHHCSRGWCLLGIWLWNSGVLSPPSRLQTLQFLRIEPGLQVPYSLSYICSP